MAHGTGTLNIQGMKYDVQKFTGINNCTLKVQEMIHDILNILGMKKNTLNIHGVIHGTPNILGKYLQKEQLWLCKDSWLIK